MVVVEVVPADAEYGHGAGGGGQRRECLLVSQVTGVTVSV